MSRVDIAVIGCGAATKRYFVPALQFLSNRLQTLYLVDTNLTSAVELASILPNAIPIKDHVQVLGKVNGAIVIVPNAYHFSVSRDFLNSGAHVLVEKPLTERARDAEDLCRLAALHRVQVMVNNTRRLFPSFQKVRELLAFQAIGTLTSIRYREGNVFAWPSATGFYVNPAVTSRGLVADIGAHVLDTICWWLAAKPDFVMGADDSFGGPESVASIRLRAGECQIDVLLNRLTELDNGFKLIGTKGSISGAIFDWTSLRMKDAFGRQRVLRVRATQKNYPEFVLPILANFLDAISGDVAPTVPGLSVIPSLQLIDEYYAKRQRSKQSWYEDLDAPNVR